MKNDKDMPDELKPCPFCAETCAGSQGRRGITVGIKGFAIVLFVAALCLIAQLLHFSWLMGSN